MGLRTPFLRFLVVGTAGFAVDAGALYVLTMLGGHPLAMRVISFLLALQVTWRGNRDWAFAGRAGSPPSFLRYLQVQAAGMAVNYAVFSGVVMWLGTTPVAAVWATAAGSAVALIVTFAGNLRLVFGPDRNP